MDTMLVGADRPEGSSGGLPQRRIAGEKAHHSRRQALRLYLGVVTAGVSAGLAACAPGQQPALKDGGGDATSRPANAFWYSRGNDKPEEIDQMLTEWRAAHPNWNLTVTPGMNDDKVATMVAAGEQMDVLTWYQTARMVNQSMNLFASLDDYVKRDRWDTSQYSQSQLELTGKVSGKLYALPYAYGGDAPFGFVYNRGLFREAGVPEPVADWNNTWTWDQFTDGARKLTRRSGSGQTQAAVSGFGHYVNTIPLLWEARWLADDYKTIQCDSPAMIDAYQKYLDLVLRDRASSASPGADLGSGNAFHNAKAAITTACCSAPNFTQQIPEGIDWAFAPLPKGKISTPDVQPTIAGLPSLGKEREVGWSLLQFLLDKSRLANLQKRQPAVPKDVETWVEASYNDRPGVRTQVIVDGTKIARAIDPIRFHPRYNEMNKDIIMPAWQEMINGEQTAVQVLRRIKPQLQAMVGG